jgi:hypothetical protein
MADKKSRMVENLKNIIIDTIKILYILLILYVAYQVVKAILGGTWNSENIIIAGIGIILGGMFVIVEFLMNQAKSLGTLEERTKNIGQSLYHLGNDFKQHISKKNH